MVRSVLLLAAGLALAGCGEERTPYGLAGEVRAYLAELRLVLQQIRGLEDRVTAQISGDTAPMSRIIPLIRQDFRPTVATQLQRARQLQHPIELKPLAELVDRYLSLRLQAYDAALHAADTKRYELFSEFSRLQAEADVLRPTLEAELQKIRQAVPGR